MTTVFIPQPTPSTENMKTRLANETSLAGESGEPYLVADLFCGAGGSSTGAERAIALTGRRMELVAVNHWPVAVETHQLNHPTARHYVQDIERADPEAIVPGGRLDLLMASPECTYHSRARGGKPIHDQGRMHPWAVHNWLARLDVNAVLVENVPEFADWGPLDENDRPDKSQKGLHFQTWFLRFHSLGYKAEWRMLNAADHGDATSRVRFFLMARKDGLPIRWPEPSHAKGDTGMLPGRRPWRGAREIINWNNLGRSLLEDPKYRKKPLSVKTRQRIARGLQRFGGPLAPLYIRLLDLPAEEGETPEQTTAPERAATPERADPGNRGGFILNRHGENGSVRVHSVADPTPTATTRGAGYLVQSEASPFIAANRNNNVPKSINEPIPPATTAHGGGSFLVEPAMHPFMLGQQSGATPRSTDDPVPTIATEGAISLIQPLREPFVLSHQRSIPTRSMDDPIPGMTAKGPGYLVQPAIIQYYGQSEAQGVDDPLSAVTGSNKHALAQPVLIQYYNNSDASSVEEPLPTVTTHDRHALASPTLVEINHGAADSEENAEGRRTPSLDEPLNSPTTRRGLGLIRPLLIQTGQTGGNGIYVRTIDQPLPTLTTKNDMNLIHHLAHPYIVPNFGERETQQPRVHDVEDPLPAVTSRGAGSLVSPTLSEAVFNHAVETGIDPRRIILIDHIPHLLDIRFRMLQNSELARAMGFEDDETSYEFAGNIGEVTKQIGNAVPVHLAAALVGAIIAGPNAGDAGDAGHNPG